jgi:hypothetical protein
MKNKLSLIFLVSLVVFAILIISPQATAQPSYPMVVEGWVTIEGVLASTGTLINFINDDTGELLLIQVIGGPDTLDYEMVVPGWIGLEVEGLVLLGGSTGQTITMLVNGDRSSSTFTWQTFGTYYILESIDLPHINGGNYNISFINEMGYPINGWVEGLQARLHIDWNGHHEVGWIDWGIDDYGYSYSWHNLVPGDYYLSFRNNGDRYVTPANYYFTINEGQIYTDTLVVEFEGPNPTNGLIYVASSPTSAVVYIDNNLWGTTPVLSEITAGTHNLRVSKTGYHSYIETFTISAGQTLEFHPILSPLEPNTAIINVYSVPSDANAYLDTNYIGNTPIDNYEIAPGTHTLLISKDGYYDSTRTFTILSGQVRTFNFNLVEIPNPSIINVYSVPSNANVYLDDNYIGNTPIDSYEITAGTHNLRISKNGYYPYTETFTISEGQTITFNFNLVEIPNPSIINVYSTPSLANAYIDDYQIGETPIDNYEVSSGTHTLRVTREGYYPHIETFTILE